MTDLTRVRKYAKALYLAALDCRSLAPVTGDLELIEQVFNQSPKSRSFYQNPMDSPFSLAELTETLFEDKVTLLTWRTLKLMLQNHREQGIPLLPAAFRQVKRSEEGIVEVLVESASPLSEATLDILKGKILPRCGTKIQLSRQVNPSLLGGFRISWNNRVLDSSLQGRIRDLRSKIK